MTVAPVWQHAVAIASAVAALGWLLRRSFHGKGDASEGGAPGPCSHCPARKGGPIEQTVQLRKRQAPRGQA